MKLAALLLVPMLAAAQVARIDVAETSGLRRFGYPVRARIKTSLPLEKLRLTADATPVVAQFTRIENGAVEIDFTVDLGPWEKRRLLVGEGVPPPVSAPMSLEQTTTSYIVRHSGGLAFQVPKSLLGLLHSVQTPDTEYLMPGSLGLILNTQDNGEHRAAATTSRIVKSGPLACALRFDSTEQLRGNRTVKSAVELEFPRSKSWAEVRWTVDDPDALVSGLTAEVNLRTDGQPLIVDFGAGTMIYATVRGGQSARMRANASAWSIEVNGESYAAGREQRAEGWAHVMDRHRAVAVAIADFTDPEASIEAWADGRLRIRRDRLTGIRKSLTFWLHFVETPVQIGAATSPQSMMRPPSVHVE